MAHGEDLRQITGDDALAQAVVADYTTAKLAPRERVLLDWAVKLTRSPERMTREDLAPLREAGFSDRAILDATHIVGFFNHINRLADALGVDLEPEMPPDPRSLR